MLYLSSVNLFEVCNGINLKYDVWVGFFLLPECFQNFVKLQMYFYSFLNLQVKPETDLKHAPRPIQFNKPNLE